MLALIVVFIGYNGTENYIPEIKKADFSGLFVESPQIGIEKKKVLVLGRNLHHFSQNTLATPYLNWELATKHFNKLEDYQTISEIYKNISKDYPEVIIDEANMAEALFRNLPTLREKYREDEENAKVWWLKPQAIAP